MRKLTTWLTRRSEAAPVLTDRQLAATFRRALSAVLEGDYPAAEREISAAVRSDSEDIEPYRALARLYRQRGEIGRAIQIHQNLLLRRDLDAAGRNAVLAELAADFRQGGFLERALASYEEVLAHEPRNRLALRAATELLTDAGNYDEALVLLRRLARVEKRRDAVGEARLLLRTAEALHRAGNHEAARKAVKRALKLDPASPEARILLGRLEAERGKNKAALAAWRAVLEAGGPEASRVHPLVESAYAAVGRARDYEAFVRELLATRPRDATARQALAQTLAGRGEVNAAILELRRVLDLAPDDVAARIAIGRLLLAEGRAAEAAKEYGELLEWLDHHGRGGAFADEFGGGVTAQTAPPPERDDRR